MILEELVGSFVSLCSSVIAQTPPISREQRQFRLIYEETDEQDEVHDSLIHREYEKRTQSELPYYEDDIFASVQTNVVQPSRNFAQSFLRSLKANVGFIAAVLFILSLLTISAVYVDLNTTDACVQWEHHNHSIPRIVRILRVAGWSTKLVPPFTWFPACVAMLWGFKEFKKNYLLRLLVCQLVIGSISCLYNVIMFDELVSYTEYRLPLNILFIISILCCAFLVTHKFKKVNPTTTYGFFQIFFTLSFAFLGSCLIAYMYTYIIIEYFKGTEGKFKKAVIAATMPGLLLPFTAIAKYVVLRKSSEIITPDRAFVLCYFIRGAAIMLYRTMQSDFQNIWLFISLSLLHGVSNVLSKATLNLRIKMWKAFVKCLNNTCCGVRLQVQALNTSRIRRLNADLEIQNILFEYTTVIWGQAYLAYYLIVSFDVPPWQIIQSSLTRIAISLASDFVFNLISVFIQIHYYDIPMRRVWARYWLRHVIANALIIISIVSYFGTSLIRVFEGYKYSSKEYKLRNCTAIF